MVRDNIMDGVNKNMSKKIIKEIVSWIFVFAFAIIFAKALNKYVVVNVQPESGSMEDTIQIERGL